MAAGRKEETLYELSPFSDFFPRLPSPKDDSSPPLVAPGLGKVNAHRNPLGEFQTSQQTEVWIQEL